MLVLSVQQPYAWAIVHAGKDVENRTWAPPVPLFGRRIGIQASKRVMPVEPYELLGKFTLDDVDVPELRELPRGAILGSVRLLGVTRTGLVGDVVSRWYTRGSIGWVLADPIPLKTPIPCRGRLGLWEAPDYADEVLQRTAA